jgi:periplasmic protein TonB
MGLFDELQDSRRRPAPRVMHAAWVTIGSHAIVALALTWWSGRGKPDTSTPPNQPPSTQLVWIQRPGLPGGGGKYGNNSPQPAARAERPGAARITVPARVPPSPGDREPAMQEISVPAVPEASGLREVPGDVSTLSLTAYTGAGPGSQRGSGEGDGNGLGPGRHGSTGDGPGGPGSSVQPPELIAQVRPEYTSGAMLARVQGVVGLEAVVMPDGTVGDVRIIRSLDRSFGLDQQAISAVKRWRFRPARRLGTAVPMFVSIELTFSLR